MRFWLPLCLGLVLPAAGGAGAQTNLGIVGGALVPVGDFNQTSDVSPYIGARYEIRDVNPLGRVAAMSYHVYGGTAFLQGQQANGNYFEIGLGTRVYSRSNGLFVGAGAGYVNYNPPGPSSSSNGLGLQVGLGLSTGMTSFRLEIEGRGNIAFLEGSDSIGSFLVLIGLGFPF